MDAFDFKLTIPPGAIAAGKRQKVCLRVLTDFRENNRLEEDEMVASFGFQVTHGAVEFKKPVKLTMPHCAIIPDPSKVDVVLYRGCDDDDGRLHVKTRLTSLFV